MKNKFFDYTPTDGSGTYSVCYGNTTEDLKKFFSLKKITSRSPIYIVDENLPHNYIKIFE